MTITVSTDDKRSVKALAVLSTSDRWQRGHLKADGRSFYAVPSSDGSRYYMVDTRDCNCPDRAYRGVGCCHIIAVRLRVAQLKSCCTSPRCTAAAVPLVGRLMA